jgi:hypothetical protein
MVDVLRMSVLSVAGLLPMFRVHVGVCVFHMPGMRRTIYSRTGSCIQVIPGFFIRRVLVLDVPPVGGMVHGFVLQAFVFRLGMVVFGMLLHGFRMLDRARFCGTFHDFFYRNILVIFPVTVMLVVILRSLAFCHQTLSSPPDHSLIDDNFHSVEGFRWIIFGKTAKFPNKSIVPY